MLLGIFNVFGGQFASQFRIAGNDGFVNGPMLLHGVLGSVPIADRNPTIAASLTVQRDQGIGDDRTLTQVANGIVELVIFLVLLVVYVRMLCVSISREKDWTSRIHQIALLSGVAGFMVQAMTDYSFYNYRVMFIFWAYLALGVPACRRSELPEGRILV